MTVKELKEELSFYEDTSDVIFEIDDDIEPESVTEHRYGEMSVHLADELHVTFMSEIDGNMRIELAVG